MRAGCKHEDRVLELLTQRVAVFGQLDERRTLPLEQGEPPLSLEGEPLSLHLRYSPIEFIQRRSVDLAIHAMEHARQVPDALDQRVDGRLDFGENPPSALFKPALIPSLGADFGRVPHCGARCRRGLHAADFLECSASALCCRAGHTWRAAADQRPA